MGGSLWGWSLAAAMSWELLLLLAVAGVAAQEPRYQVNQLESISAPAGSSVTLPCNFSYPNNIKPVRDLRVYWRQGGFHGKFIYNHTERFTHQDYRNRITLVGDPRGEHTASICIDRLQESDASVYVCHLRVWKNNGQWEQWRNITGTNLTVLARAQDPRCEVSQPMSVSAPVGSSVTLPCSFLYPCDTEPLQDLRVYWRRGGWHGEFIYNDTEGFAHSDYKGHMRLVGDLRGNHTASIRIDQLRASDASVYVCHVTAQRKDGKWQQWHNIAGTTLTVPEPAALHTVHVILISLGSVVAKFGICILVFTLGWWLRCGPDPGNTS